MSQEKRRRPVIGRQEALDLLREDQERERRVQIDKLRSEQAVEDVKWLMSQPAGRRVMNGLLATTGVFRSSFTGDSKTFFNEGRRDVGLFYLSIAQSMPAEFMMMLQEQAENGN